MIRRRMQHWMKPEKQQKPSQSKETAKLRSYRADSWNKLYLKWVFTHRFWCILPANLFSLVSATTLLKRLKWKVSVWHYLMELSKQIQLEVSGVFLVPMAVFLCFYKIGLRTWCKKPLGGFLSFLSTFAKDWKKRGKRKKDNKYNTLVAADLQVAVCRPSGGWWWLAGSSCEADSHQ